MHVFDLEDRSFRFAKKVRAFIREVPKDIPNLEDCKQLTRSSGSVGANYIEANEAISPKDFIHRIKICRKEVKETRYWLELLEVKNNNLEIIRSELVGESIELLKIFNAIITKSTKNNY